MDISWVREHLLKRLTDQQVIESVTEKFHHLNEIDAKVSFVKNALIDLKYMKAIERSGKLRKEKSNDKSLQFRILGDQQYSLMSNKGYFKALRLYNRSICFSESGSENLPIGYAKRSAVLFALELYYQSMENIYLARRAANFPVQLQPELDRREAHCRHLLAERAADVPPPPFEFMLSEDPHDTVPHIADCLEMRSSENAGRFIVTKRELDVGDMIATEEPFCTTLLPEMRYVRCVTCKQENHLTLIPCERCTSVMFCSDRCRIIANANFHKFECPIIDFLYKWCNPIHCNALRTCLSALDLFPTIGELMEFCANRQNQNCSVFDLNYGNFTSREHYRAINGLVTNQASRSLRNLYDLSVASAVLEHFIIEHTPVKNFLGGVKGERFFRQLLCQHLQTSTCNMHAIDVIHQPNEVIAYRNHSVGIFPFLSLLNHSCAPNTIRVYRGTKAYLFVLRPIPANGQLFDSYGMHFENNSREVRQIVLQRKYHFTCNCDACENNYPIYDELPKYNIPAIAGKFDRDYIMAFDAGFAIKNYRNYCEFLSVYSDVYPCEEIRSAEDYLIVALHILVDAVPLRAKYF